MKNEINFGMRSQHHDQRASYRNDRLHALQPCADLVSSIVVLARVLWCSIPVVVCGHFQLHFSCAFFILHCHYVASASPPPLLGSMISTVVPGFSRRTAIVPPNPSMMLRVIGSPRPVPVRRVVKYGSNICPTCS